MKARIVLIGIVALGFLIHKIFFVDSGEVLNFNDSLVEMVVSSEANFDPFLQFIGQYYEGEKVDVAAMTQARDTLKTEVESDVQALTEMTVPDDELCKSFHSSCLDYVSNSSDIVDKYEEQVAYIAKNNPGNEENMAALGAIVADLLEKDEQLLESVAEIQGKMAEKFDFELE